MLAELPEGRLASEEGIHLIKGFQRGQTMLMFKRLLFIVFLSSGSILTAGQDSFPPPEGDIALGFVHFETIAVGDTGEGHHRPDIVVRTTNQTSRIQTFGISNEAGVLIEPLPPGRYCYEAFSATGRHLKMKRPAAERCFDVEAGKDGEVGVEFLK
jgi:hypothetical protein